jgi:hypothetical protein
MMSKTIRNMTGTVFIVENLESIMSQIYVKNMIGHRHSVRTKFSSQLVLNHNKQEWFSTELARE